MAAETSDWQHWFDRHGAALILFARQRTATYADAEDAVQAAFVRFWKRRGQVRDPLTYLYSCVASAAADQGRGESRRREHERQAWFSRPTPDAQLDTEEIETAVAALPSEQREVLVLKTWSGLTFKEIAEVLSIPANTAASRYRYAIAALRKRLTQETNP